MSQFTYTCTCVPIRPEEMVYLGIENYAGIIAHALAYCACRPRRQSSAEGPELVDDTIKGRY